MPRGPVLSPEESARRKKAAWTRVNAASASPYGHDDAHARDELLDDGDDPLPLVQKGDNRSLFNLGNGARWHRGGRGRM